MRKGAGLHPEDFLVHPLLLLHNLLGVGAHVHLRSQVQVPHRTVHARRKLHDAALLLARAPEVPQPPQVPLALAVVVVLVDEILKLGQDIDQLLQIPGQARFDHVISGCGAKPRSQSDSLPHDAVAHGRILEYALVLCFGQDGENLLDHVCLQTVPITRVSIGSPRDGGTGVTPTHGEWCCISSTPVPISIPISVPISILHTWTYRKACK